MCRKGSLGRCNGVLIFPEKKGGRVMCLRRKMSLFSVCLIVALVVSLGWTGSSRAQEKYPTRAIDIIVPFAPGGSSDLMARFTAEVFKKKWGVAVNVINKPGGNTVPAQLEVYRAKPDGYTIFSDSQSASSLLEVAMKDLPVKVLDRTFIALTTASPHVFWVPSTSPIKNIKDLEAEAKKDPEHFTWTSFGGVGAGDFLMRQFFKAINLDIAKTKPVVTRGGTESVTLAAGGHVKLASSSPVSGVSHLKAGTVRVAGVSGYRVPDFPNVLTTAEQGYPAVNAVFWTGFSGPPKLPASIVAKWDETVQEVLKDQEFLGKMTGIGFVPFYRNSAQAREHVRKEMEEAVKLWGVK
jgi:tripartite-type tricarboxylate transporter receptor subunit TctC